VKLGRSDGLSVGEGGRGWQRVAEGGRGWRACSQHRLLVAGNASHADAVGRMRGRMRASALSSRALL
jgi:hypothetical protein